MKKPILNRSKRSKGSQNQRICLIFQEKDVPTKIIKENANIFTDFVHPSINTSISNVDFQLFLKVDSCFLENVIANVIPVLKKDCKNSKDIYRPIIILKNISEVYKRIFKQIGAFMDNFFFSKFQCGFRKDYSTQQCLLALTEKWKSAVDKSKSFGALSTDLPKAFDCLPHEFLIAKLQEII